MSSCKEPKATNLKKNKKRRREEQFDEQGPYEYCDNKVMYLFTDLKMAVNAIINKIR